MDPNEILRQKVKQFCVEIARDRALVQAAGGNVSWKTDTELWIKASGMWLADAKNKSIFVPVNLVSLNEAIKRGDYSFKPEILNNQKNRPSIETLLHALMPQKIVAHLHLVDLMARLIRKDCEKDILQVMADDYIYAFVDYCKPGPDLAEALHVTVKSKNNIDIIFLKNHGIVIGADKVEDVRRIINNLLVKTKINPRTMLSKKADYNNIKESIIGSEYIECKDALINQLVLEPDLYKSLREDWAICPDHVVFLGSKAICIESINELTSKLKNSESPPYIFIQDQYVLESKKVTKTQKAQLIFYIDVMLRSQDTNEISYLNHEQRQSLINWDAEIFRKKISK